MIKKKKKKAVNWHAQHNKTLRFDSLKTFVLAKVSQCLKPFKTNQRLGTADGHPLDQPSYTKLQA